MRGITIWMAVLLVLGACRGEPEVQRPASASHAALVASMAGNYLWDCDVRNEAGTAQWRFVLQARAEGSATEVYLVEVGREFGERLGVRTRGAARIYEMKDRGEILVASDGEVFTDGPRSSRAQKFSTGRCTRGGA